MTSFSVAFWKQNKDNRTQSRALGKRKGIPTKDNTDAEGSFWALRKSSGMKFSSKLGDLHCTWNSNKGFSSDNHKTSHWLPISFCLHLKQRFVGASCLNLWNFLYLIDSPRCSLKSLFCVFTLIITCMKWWIYEFRINFRFLGNCPPTPPLTQHFAPSETQMLTLS